MPRLIRLNLTLIALLAALPGCSHRVTAPETATGRAVAIETANAARGTIGVEGGSVSATSSKGIHYTLIVPAGAIAAPTVITITPVSGITTLPGGSLAAAIECQPSGLRFARSAYLLVNGAGDPHPGEIPIGFTATAAGDSFALVAGLPFAGGQVIEVSHFSLQGLAFGTTAQLASYPSPPPSATEQGFVDAIFRDVADGDLDAARAVAHQWESTQLVPELGLAADDVTLLVAAADYEAWRGMIDYINGTLPLSVPAAGSLPAVTVHFEDPAFAGDVHDCGEAAAPPLRDAIAGNQAVACDQQSFAAFDNVRFWQTVATNFEVGDAAHQLDIGPAIEGTCVRVVVVSESLPAILQAGFPHSVDVTFALELGDASHRRAGGFDVHMEATNATLQHPNGFTDAGGHYTTVITAISTGPIVLSAHACFEDLPLCADDHFDSQVPVGIDLTGTYTGTLTRVINGFTTSHTENWTMSLVQNQNAVTGTYSGGDGHTGTFSATLSSDGTFSSFGLVNTGACDGSFAQNQIGRTRVAIDDQTGQVLGIGFDLRELDCHVNAGDVNLMEGLMSGPGAAPAAARPGGGRAVAAGRPPATSAP